MGIKMNCLSGKVKSSFNDTILYVGILDDFDNWLALQDIMQNPYIYIFEVFLFKLLRDFLDFLEREEDINWRILVDFSSHYY